MFVGWLGGERTTHAICETGLESEPLRTDGPDGPLRTDGVDSVTTMC